ncbi:hypothetical protein NDU88_002116 [Pleurodeles waltl]|uniref:Uncharacterized protein n=1 Tax=Pleurodeles waltl TaxID=8319 RepID=A0AAV7T1X9_PLEWA|nr:hypothetical protein NDU88_002116 [Pleurodeles waltl]
MSHCTCDCLPAHASLNINERRERNNAFGNHSDTEPVLLFCKALYDILLGVWTHPASGPSMDCSVSHRHQLAQIDLLCLRHHPPPEGFVTQTALGVPALKQVPPIPPHRDSRQLDAALRSTNTSRVLSHFSHALWDSVECLLSSISDNVRPALMSLIRDGQQDARLAVRAGMDSTDSIGQIMVASVAIRRRAWLAASNFSSPV